MHTSTKGLRHAQTLGDAVDRVHVRRADRARDLHSAQADRAETQDRHRVPRAQSAFLDGMKARSHYIAREQRHVAAHPVGDAPQHEVGARHERHVRLRALQRAERGAVPERARLLTAVVQAAPAEPARPTRRLKAAEHTIADRHARDGVADRGHRANVLVPDREARLDLHAPVEDVQVRAAHARRLDPDDRVFGIDRLGLGALLDADDAGGLEGDGSHGLRERTTRLRRSRPRERRPGSCGNPRPALGERP
jgi:hypothetical protein